MLYFEICIWSIFQMVMVMNGNTRFVYYIETWGSTISMAPFSRRVIISFFMARDCLGSLTTVTLIPLKVGGWHWNWIMYPFDSLDSTQGSVVCFSQQFRCCWEQHPEPLGFTFLLLPLPDKRGSARSILTRETEPARLISMPVLWSPLTIPLPYT